jgi:hypothetical protein
MHAKFCWAWSALLLAAVAAAVAGGPQTQGEPPQQPPPKSAAEQYKALVKEVTDARQEYTKAMQAAKTDEDRQKAFQEKYPQPAKYAARFLKVAEDFPKDPAAVDALIWVCTNFGNGPEYTKALDVLLKDHADSPRLAAVCASLGRTPNGEQRLRDLLAKSPHRDVQGAACFALAQFLKSRADRGVAGAEDVQKEAETLFERVVKDYAEVKTGERPLGPLAETELFEMRYLSVGKVAPEIEAEDIDGVKFKLSDYRGKVVMLDFWGNW